LKSDNINCEFNTILDSVTVIVVTFNSEHWIETIAKLLNECRNVVLSDNGSTDNTVERVASHVPHAQLLLHGKNLGFGVANNLALAKVSTPFAFLLNPDCKIGSSALSTLLMHADQYPDAAIIAPQLINGRGGIDLNYRWPRVCWRSTGPGADGPLCVGFVSGAAMLLRVNLFKQLGFFDKEFFLYYEDDDMCLRLFREKLPIVVIPSVTAVHRSRGSVSGKNHLYSEYIRGYHHIQSKLLFTVKHFGSDQGNQLRRRLMLITPLILIFRILLFSPRLISRMWGRIIGLIQWRLPTFKS
jgi:N-acetylglucosaminyl-diphospho-decaprenol L-rhamnosyltransferase